jgi:hypothetical protein
MSFGGRRAGSAGTPRWRDGWYLVGCRTTGGLSVATCRIRKPATRRVPGLPAGRSPRSGRQGPAMGAPEMRASRRSREPRGAPFLSDDSRRGEHEHNARGLKAAYRVLLHSSAVDPAQTERLPHRVTALTGYGSAAADREAVRAAQRAMTQSSDENKMRTFVPSVPSVPSRHVPSGPVPPRPGKSWLTSPDRQWGFSASTNGGRAGFLIIC